jgi:hypothetical protein
MYSPFFQKSQKILFWKGIILMMVIFSSCRSGNYSREDAIRSLKVLNSDFTGFFSQVGEREEIKVLKFIWNHDSVPLPFPSEKFTSDKPWKPYDFESVKGVYRWDSLSRNFHKTAAVDKVRLVFSTPEAGNGEFILNDFSSVPTSSRPEFPVRLNALLKMDGEEKMTVSHSAVVTDDLPQKIQTEVLTKDSKMVFRLGRTRENDKGKLNIQVFLENKGHRFIDTVVEAGIGYSRMGYFFEDIHLRMSFFNHRASGIIRYGKIDPTAKNYEDSFNANTDIKITEMPGNRLVGRLVIGKTGKGDLLDYFICFNDGSRALLSEYLPFLNKILNMKI